VARPRRPDVRAQSGARERAGLWCGSAEQSAVLARGRWGEQRSGAVERAGGVRHSEGGVAQAFGRGPGRHSGAALVHWASGERSSAGGAATAQAGGMERADAGAREACAGARRPEQNGQGERARQPAQELAAQGDGVRGAGGGDSEAERGCIW
jgi:hypothetical protein